MPFIISRRFAHLRSGWRPSPGRTATHGHARDRRHTAPTPHRQSTYTRTHTHTHRDTAALNANHRNIARARPERRAELHIAATPDTAHTCQSRPRWHSHRPRAKRQSTHVPSHELLRLLAVEPKAKMPVSGTPSVAWSCVSSNRSSLSLSSAVGRAAMVSGP